MKKTASPNIQQLDTMVHKYWTYYSKLSASQAYLMSNVPQIQRANVKLFTSVQWLYVQRYTARNGLE